MNNDLIPAPAPRADADERVLEDGERVERSQPLQPGYYWRAVKNTKDEDGDKVPKDCVMLLQRILRVDDQPHAVELRGHPLIHGDGITFRFLVHDFLNRFEPEPNGAAIRAREMADVQAEIDTQQHDLLDFASNPARMMEELQKNPKLAKAETRADERANLPAVPFDFNAGLPGPDFRPSTAIADLADADRVDLYRKQANNQAILAKKRADLIAAKTGAIQTTVKKLTPFFNEQGAVALAQCEDALTIYGKLTSGLASLGLYTGKDVEVTEVRGGAGAAPEEPIYILQAVLMMDEESLINVEDGGGDFRNLKDFVALLATDDALLKRLIPFERGIAAMRYTREGKDYGGGPEMAFRNAAMNEENSKCFLIVRNGARVYFVQSPLEKLERLFPTQTDLDKPFTTPWVESERITVDDLTFSEARSKFDQVVLHYRRILILLAGLYDRERHVIGDIAAVGEKSGLALLALGVQQEAFRPVSDEEFALGTGRPDFDEWMKEKNARAQSGSRLLCYWKTLMTPETAPGAVRLIENRGVHSRDWIEYDYMPDEKSGVVIAYREGADLKVQVQVHGETNEYKKRSFLASVNVSKYRTDHGGFGFLCLDDVTPEEIDYYLYTRNGRRAYIHFAKLLVAARAILRADLANETPMRRALIDAMQQGGVQFDGAEESDAVRTVVRQWRASRRGAPVPNDRSTPDFHAAWTSMMDQLWIIAGKGRDRTKAAQDIAAAEGRTALRLTLSGRNRLYLYATSTPDEHENLLGTHRWVCRLTLEELKTKVTVVDRRQVLMPAVDPKESVLYESPDAKAWADPKLDHQLTYEQVRGLRDLGKIASTRASKWLEPVDDATFAADLMAVRAETRRRSTGGYVRHGHVFLPLGVARRTRELEQYESSDDRDAPFRDRKKIKVFEHAYEVVGLDVDLPGALYLRGTDAQRKTVVEWFRNAYENPKSAIDRLKTARATIATVSVDRVYDFLKEETTVGIGSGYGAKAWESDVAAVLKRVTERGVYGSGNYTAGFVLRFDDVAEAIYQLLPK